MKTYDEFVKSPPQTLECSSRVLALDEETRRVKHVISTAAIDRGNRVVDVGGWKLSKFRDNPVVMANHDYSIENVIGRAYETRVEGDSLVSTTEFAKEGLGNVAFRMIQSGLIRSWSVGWIGLKSHDLGSNDECPVCQSAEVQQLKKGKKYFYGTHYTQQELLEYSLVAIPANPEAVMGLKAAGLVAENEMAEWLKVSEVREEEERAWDDPMVLDGLAVAVPFSAGRRERSSEFYRELFELTRTIRRMDAAKCASAQFRR